MNRERALVRVLIADRCPATCFGLRELLGSAGDVEVVGECDNAGETLRLVEEMQPDLVVLDLGLAGEVDGVELCYRIKGLPEAPYVLVYTDHNFTESISSCIAAGVDSYLHKRTTCEELLESAQRTAAGEKLWNVAEHAGAEAGCQSRPGRSGSFSQRTRGAGAQARSPHQRRDS